MKKVIFGLAVVAAAALGAYYATNGSAGTQLSDLQMENLESLASDTESGSIPCKKGAVRWKNPNFSEDDTNFIVCTERCPSTSGREPKIVKCSR